MFVVSQANTRANLKIGHANSLLDQERESAMKIIMRYTNIYNL